MTAEPRMEDLLASIRRAIHDDIGEVPSSTAGESRGTLFKGAMRELRVKVGEEASAAAAEIQDLREKISRSRSPETTPPMLRPSSVENDFEPVGRLRRHSQGGFSREAETLAPAQGFWEQEASGKDILPNGMLSVEAQRETGNAFNRLAQVLLNRSGDGQSLEDMTQNLLRGMLKQWLDANLPGVVERLVREEIERVARRGR